LELRGKRKLGFYRVVRTLHVGDEPRDIVFGGPGNKLAQSNRAGGSRHLQPDPTPRAASCRSTRCTTATAATSSTRTPTPGSPIIRAFFGTDGKLSFENLTQNFKVAHLRNAYDKVGMFASAPDPNRALTPSLEFNPHPGGERLRLPARRRERIGGASPHRRRHDAYAGQPGGIPTFLTNPETGQLETDPVGFVVRRQISSFLMAYPSNLRPIVGQQVTLRAGAPPAALGRLALMQARTAVGDCDLVVKGRVSGKERGFATSSHARKLHCWL
jgi:hypothetical protein